MADSNNVLIEAPNPKHLIIFVAFVAPFVLVTMGCWIWNLQSQNDLLQNRNDKLHELIQRPAQLECPMVSVTCECPEYDEGWGDAQHANGCDSDMSGISVEELRIMCDDLATYQDIPGC